MSLLCLLPRAACAGHAMVAVGSTIWVFGGMGSAGKALNDVWAFDTKTSTWTS